MSEERGAAVSGAVPPRYRDQLGSLFSGVGGLTDGIVAGAGARPRFFCEVDGVAQAVLRRRYPDAQVVGDIRGVRRLPRLGLLEVGLPCTGTSLRGSRKGMENQQTGLFDDVIRLLADHLEAYRWLPTLVLENVPAALYHHAATGAPPVAAAILGALHTRLPYRSIAYRTLDASSVGLPQSRTRLFILASVQVDCARALFCAGGAPAPPPPARGARRGAVALDDPADARYFVFNSGEAGGVHSAGLAPTITVGNCRSLVLIGPDACGMLGVEALERLQGFCVGDTAMPPGVAAGMSLAQQDAARRRLLGNAVPPPLGAAVGRRVAVGLRTLNMRYPRAPGAPLLDPFMVAAGAIEERHAVGRRALVSLVRQATDLGHLHLMAAQAAAGRAPAPVFTPVYSGHSLPDAAWWTPEEGWRVEASPAWQPPPRAYSLEFLKHHTTGSLGPERVASVRSFVSRLRCLGVGLGDELCALLAAHGLLDSAAAVVSSAGALCLAPHPRLGVLVPAERLDADALPPGRCLTAAQSKELRRRQQAERDEAFVVVNLLPHSEGDWLVERAAGLGDFAGCAAAREAAAAAGAPAASGFASALAAASVIDRGAGRVDGEHAEGISQRMAAAFAEEARLAAPCGRCVACRARGGPRCLERSMAAAYHSMRPGARLAMCRGELVGARFELSVNAGAPFEAEVASYDPGSCRHGLVCADTLEHRVESLWAATVRVVSASVSSPCGWGTAGGALREAAVAAARARRGARPPGGGGGGGLPELEAARRRAVVRNAAVWEAIQAGGVHDAGGAAAVAARVDAAEHAASAGPPTPPPPPPPLGALPTLPWRPVPADAQLRAAQLERARARKVAAQATSTAAKRAATAEARAAGGGRARPRLSPQAALVASAAMEAVRTQLDAASAAAAAGAAGAAGAGAPAIGGLPAAPG